LRTDGRGFYHALAALLFAAVCAWLAAWLYGGLGQRAAAEEPPPPEAGKIRGILLRRELALPPGEIPDQAEDGRRLSAPESGHGAGLFLADTDGLERLSPEDAEALTPEKLDALLAAAPEEGEHAGRLVLDFACVCAAFYEGAAAPAPGPCRVRIDGAGEFEARVVSVTKDARDRTAVLLRIPEAEPLARLRFVTGELKMVS